MGGERYRVLYHLLLEREIQMVVSPDEYERAHYYPSTYPFLASISPRAAWTPVDQSALNDPYWPQLFASLVVEVENWGCQYVLMKDYVKSAKEAGQTYMKIPVSSDLGDLACDFVELR